MRKIWFGLGLIALLIGLALGGVSAWRGQPGPNPYAGTAQSVATTSIQTTYYAPLSEDEINGLLYMVEEEKLARDVYLTLYNETGLTVFSNIANSEQGHMDAVLSLIEKYNLTAPETLDQVGVFQNEELQTLYNQLVEQGSKSVIDALKVGALIEETDIEDLERWISETDNEDIKAVYSNLMKGSENHLRAFVGQLEAMGVSYTAQVLPQEKVEEILSSAPTHGMGHGHGGHNAMSDHMKRADNFKGTGTIGNAFGHAWKWMRGFLRRFGI
ncbi:DUF2202 domain-containing protein [Thermococcus sp.]